MLDLERFKAIFKVITVIYRPVAVPLILRLVSLWPFSASLVSNGVPRLPGKWPRRLWGVLRIVSSLMLNFLRKGIYIDFGPCNHYFGVGFHHASQCPIGLPVQGAEGAAFLEKPSRSPGKEKQIFRKPRRNPSMNLFFWLPAMFLLGLVLMGLFLLFLEGCDKI